MFVTRQNGVIKLKLVSSVDKSIKLPPALLAFFLMGWLEGEGVLGAAPWPCRGSGSGGSCSL